MKLKQKFYNICFKAFTTKMMLTLMNLTQISFQQVSIKKNIFSSGTPSWKWVKIFPLNTQKNPPVIFSNSGGYPKTFTTSPFAMRDGTETPLTYNGWVASGYYMVSTRKYIIAIHGGFDYTIHLHSLDDTKVAVSQSPTSFLSELRLGDNTFPGINKWVTIMIDYPLKEKGIRRMIYNNQDRFFYFVLNENTNVINKSSYKYKAHTSIILAVLNIDRTKYNFVLAKTAVATEMEIFLLEDAHVEDFSATLDITFNSKEVISGYDSTREVFFVKHGKNPNYLFLNIGVSVKCRKVTIGTSDVTISADGSLDVTGSGTNNAIGSLVSVNDTDFLTAIVTEKNPGFIDDKPNIVILKYVIGSSTLSQEKTGTLMDVFGSRNLVVMENGEIFTVSSQTSYLYYLESGLNDFCFNVDNEIGKSYASLNKAMAEDLTCFDRTSKFNGRCVSYKIFTSYCHQCESGYELPFCYQICTNTDEFRNDGGICQKCNTLSPNCVECALNPANSAEAFCTSCEPGFKVVNHNCVPFASLCPSTQVYDEIKEYCVACSSKYTNCKTCLFSPAECSGCEVKFYLQPSKACGNCIGNCDVCSDSSTCDTCTSGFFYNSGLSQCITCTSLTPNCKTCTATPQECTGCNIKYFIKADKTCGSCPLNCDQCSDGNSCSQCIADHVYVSGVNECRAKCPSGQYLDTSGSCTGCSALCVSTCADFTGVCDECITGYTKTGNICKKDCVVKEYYMAASNNCFPCSDTLCLGCEDETGNCNSCPDGYETALQKCKKTCKAREYYIESSNNCLGCLDSDCSKCENETGACSQCDDNFEVIEGECRIICEEGKYPKSLKECSSCLIDGCLRCDKITGVCLQKGKQLNYYLQYQPNMPFITFKLFILDENNKPIDDLPVFVKEDEVKEMFKVTLDSQELSSYVTKTSEGDYIVNVQYKEEENTKNNEENLNLKFEIKDPKIISEDFQISQSDVKITKIPKAVDNTPPLEKQLESTSMATASSTRAVTDPAFIGPLATFDPSGMVLMSNQFISLTKRFLFLNINYGKNFEIFLENLADLEDKNKMRILADSKGKFNKYGISLKLDGKLKLKSIIYLSVYFLGLVQYPLIIKMEINKKINLKSFKLIKIARKLHFIGFGIVMMDFFFYGIRLILHSDYSVDNSFVKFISVIIMALVSLDIAILCFSIQKVEIKLEFVKKQKKDKEEGNVEESKLELDRSKVDKMNEDVKEIDFEETIKYIKNTNTAMVDFLAANINLEKDYKNSNLPFYSNFLFSIRLLLFQILLSALPHLPGLQIPLILLIELLYFLYNVYTYLKYRHFSSLLIFIAKVLQSLFIICLFFVFYLIYFKNISIKDLMIGTKITPGMQKFGIIFIMISIFVDYILAMLILILKLLVTLKEKMFSKKKKKNSGEEIKKEEEIEGFVYMKKYSAGIISSDMESLKKKKGGKAKRFRE